jgi:purine-cytosine permease-like protein
MPVKRIKEFLERAEIFLEDFILVLLSIVVIILSISALLVLTTQIPAEVHERVETLKNLLPHLNFLAKAEYFASLILPWIVMIVGLLIFRELWMIRRALERIEIRKMIETHQKSRKKGDSS